MLSMAQKQIKLTRKALKTDPESYISGLCLEFGINFSFIYFFKTLRGTNLLKIYGSTPSLETLSFNKQSDFKNKRL